MPLIEFQSAILTKILQKLFQLAQIRFSKIISKNALTKNDVHASEAKIYLNSRVFMMLSKQEFLVRSICQSQSGIEYTYDFFGQKR